ncbi:MAG: glycoside hydrolase domain-containing protein [Planctomycetota bacterium]
MQPWFTRWLLRLSAAALLVSSRLPAQEPELLLRVTFDDLTANAQVAQGNPKSSLTRDLGLTAKEGFNKKTALVLGDGEECAYEIRGNLNLSAGTISFWARPYNWNDTEGRFKKFFQVYGSEDGVPFGMYIDSPNSPGAARVVMNQGESGRAGSKLYQFNGRADWKSRKWHKIDVTWDERHLAIYVNGRLGERKEIEGIRFPKFEKGKFRLVPIFHSGDGTFHNGQDRSLIDDFEIHGGPLSADRILQRYLADIGGELPPPALIVPRASTPVLVDGRLDEGTWSTASRVPILINAATTYPHSQWACASICYDDANLYVGFRSDKNSEPPLVAARERDGNVWEDDAFELFLTPAPTTPKDFFQFVFNAASVVYDARHGQSHWNGRVSVKTAVADDHWTAEAAIPFADLDAGTPQAGDTWLGNFCRDWARPKPARTIYTGWAYIQGGFLLEPEKYGRLIFTDSTRGASLDLSPALNTGTLDATAAIGGPGKLDVSVKSESGTVFQETADFNNQTRITKRLKDVKEGVLSIVMKADAQDLLSFSTRFMANEPVEIAWLPDPVNKKLGLIADLSNVEPEWLSLVAAGKAALDVSLAGPKADKGAASFPLDQPTGTFTIPCAYEAGDYELTCRLRAAGMARPLEMIKTLEMPELPWADSQVGISDQVLDPWTPLKYQGDARVSCWGRTYAFDGPFLKEAVNRGRNVLAGPITMTLTTPAGTGELVSTGSKPLRQDPHRAEIVGTGNFGPAGIDADWSMWMEYDGLTVATVTLKPAPEGCDVHRFVLRIPLRSDLVKYLRGGTHMGMIKTGRIAWDGKRHEDAFQPFLWACTETEGFLYFCESEAGWVNPAGARTVVVQAGIEAFIELTIIGQDVRMARPQSYTFGFQATPVKPLAKDRRAWNFGMHGPTKHINARNWMTGYSEQDGHWKVLNVEAVRKFDAAQRAEGVKLLYYGCTSCTPDHNPTYNLYEKLWASSFAASYSNVNDATQFRPAWVPYRLAAVCPGDRSFQEFMLYCGDKFLRQCGVPGLYMDTDGVMACDNPYHGHRFTDQFGKTGVTYTILSKRDFSKRLAAIVRSFPDERRWWMTHSHAKLVPPVHAFADFWLPGEENTHQLRGNKWWYMDTLDDVAWRVEYADHASGLVHTFLPEFMRGTADKSDLDGPQPSDSLLAMCAVTDVNTTGGFMNRDAMGEWWGLRKRLDLINADFVGYWEDNCPVKTATPEALVSLYKTPGGRFIIPVTNRLPNPIEVTVTVDLTALGLEGKVVTAVDERTGKPLELKDGTFTVPVRERNYTFASLTGK